MLIRMENHDNINILKVGLLPFQRKLESRRINKLIYLTGCQIKFGMTENEGPRECRGFR